MVTTLDSRMVLICPGFLDLTNIEIMASPWQKGVEHDEGSGFSMKMAQRNHAGLIGFAVLQLKVNKEFLFELSITHPNTILKEIKCAEYLVFSAKIMLIKNH